jgi:sulfate permease, SulP family
VITGFTAGIAVIIFSSQIKDFFGLEMGAVPAHFADKWIAYWRVADTFDPVTLAVGAGTLLVVVLWPRVSTKVPGPFVAMLAATVAVQVLGLDVATIGSRFGAVPSMLPAPSFPSVPWEQVRELVSPAITIALLAAIESLLSAVVADGMIGTRHKSNMELVAQGVANVASVTFGGIPATGAIARTATNVKAGGRTPIAGVVHAVTLLLVLVFLARWAALIPLASLAAILVIVSWHMSEWRSFRNLLSAPRSDIAVLLSTFLLTVIVDLTVAVQVGVVLAAVLFMKRMSEVTEIEGVTDQIADPVDLDSTLPGYLPDRLTRDRVPPGVEVYEVNGPFFFGAADKLKDTLGEVARRPKVFILRMRHVPAIDATGLHALEQFARKCQAGGSTLIISEVRSQPRRAIVRSRLFQTVGRHNFAHDIEAALEKARAIVGEG